MIAAILASLLLSGTVNASTLTVAWDANTESDIANYVVQIGTATGGPYVDASFVPGTTTTTTVPNLTAGATYYLIVRAINTRGFWSSPSNEISVTMPVGPASDDCAAITGHFAVSIFPTSLLKTGTKGPGTKTRLDYQLGSPNSPITTIVVAANAVLLSRQEGIDLTGSAGQWFTMPASGNYGLTITASNKQGCTRTVSFGQLVVP